MATGYRVRLWEYVREGWNVFWQWPSGFFAVALLGVLLDEIIMILAPTLSIIGISISWIVMAGIALASWRRLNCADRGIEDFMPEGRAVLRLVVIGVLMAVAGCVFLVGELTPIWWFVSQENVRASQAIILILVLLAWLFTLMVALIYCVVGVSFAQLLIIDRRLSVLKAVMTSFRIVRKNWWGVCGLVALTLSIVVLPWLLVTTPVEWLFDAYFADAFTTFLLGEIDFIKSLESPWSSFGEGFSYNLGVLVTSVLASSIGIAIAACVYAVAYADIFGLPRARHAK